MKETHLGGLPDAGSPQQLVRKKQKRKKRQPAISKLKKL